MLIKMGELKESLPLSKRSEAMYQSAARRLRDTATELRARIPCELGSEEETMHMQDPEYIRAEQQYDAVMDQIPEWRWARDEARGIVSHSCPPSTLPDHELDTPKNNAPARALGERGPYGFLAEDMLRNEDPWSGYTPSHLVRTYESCGRRVEACPTMDEIGWLDGFRHYALRREFHRRKRG